MLPTKVRFIWPTGFRADDCLVINQSETRIVCGGHIQNRMISGGLKFIHGFKWVLTTV
jgi:hypothetical protein